MFGGNVLIIDNEPAFIHYNHPLETVCYCIVCLLSPSATFYYHAYWPNGCMLKFKKCIRYSFNCYSICTIACHTRSRCTSNRLIERWLIVSWHIVADIIQFSIGCDNRLHALLLYVYCIENLIKPFFPFCSFVRIPSQTMVIYTIINCVIALVVVVVVFDAVVVVKHFYNSCFKFEWVIEINKLHVVRGCFTFKQMLFWFIYLLTHTHSHFHRRIFFSS